MGVCMCESGPAVPPDFPGTARARAVPVPCTWLLWPPQRGAAWPLWTPQRGAPPPEGGAAARLGGAAPRLGGAAPRVNNDQASYQ